MQNLCSNRFAVQHQGYFNIANSCSSKLTVFGNVAPAFIRYRPGYSLRHIDRVTRRAYRLGTHLNGRAYSQVCNIRLNDRMIESSRAGCGGNHDKRGGYRAGSTVGRSADNRKVLITGLFGHERGRSAAVQVDRVDTAGILHDLCNFDHASAAGEGLLSAVQNHQDNLTGLGDTNRRAAGTILPVFTGGRNDDLTVQNQRRSESANSFLQLVLIRCIVAVRTNDRLAILQNSEEAAAVNRMPLLAIHDQESTGFTGRHVVAVRIGADDYIVVRDIVRALGIAVSLLSGVGLIENTLHRPALTRIGIVVVRLNMYIASGDIGSGNVVYHLLSIRGSRVLDGLVNTRGKIRRRAAEYRQIRVHSRVDVVARELTQVIRKRIAAGRSHHFDVFGLSRVEFSGAFQRRDDLIDDIRIVNRITDIVSEAYAAQALVQKERSALFVIQALGEVCLHQRRHIARLIVGSIQRLHYIERVKVSVHVGR